MRGRNSPESRSPGVSSAQAQLQDKNFLLLVPWIEHGLFYSPSWQGLPSQLLTAQPRYLNSETMLCGSGGRLTQMVFEAGLINVYQTTHGVLRKQGASGLRGEEADPPRDLTSSKWVPAIELQLNTVALRSKTVLAQREPVVTVGSQNGFRLTSLRYESMTIWVARRDPSRGG